MKFHKGSSNYQLINYNWLTNNQIKSKIEWNVVKSKYEVAEMKKPST